jgi:stress response protein SCP2
MAQDIQLTFSEGASKLMVGLSWDYNEEKAGVLEESIQPHNLDLSCVVLGAGMRVRDIITPDSPKRDEYKAQIFHMGDHLTGGSDYEDEEIQVNFDKLDSAVSALAFVVSVNGKVKFSEVKNGSCAFCDAATLAPFLSVGFAGSQQPHYLVGVIVKNDVGGWVLKDVQAELLALDAGVVEGALEGVV